LKTPRKVNYSTKEAAMTNKRSRLLLTVLGGGSDPAASFTVTTTGAATLTINWLVVSASTTVDWGDGSSDAYTAGAGARTHNYAGAGTWLVRILQPLNVTEISLQDLKITNVPGAQIVKMINLITLQLVNQNVLPWTVGAGAPMPTSLTTLQMISCTGITWTVGAGAPMPTQVTSLVLSNLPASVNYTSGLATNLKLDGVVTLTNNNFSATEVDAILLDLYTAAQSRTSVAAWSLNISGPSNAAPSGTYAATCPPTTGKAAAYEIINDSCGVIAAGKEMSAVTVTGGLP
jgi:hypothetical protein